MTSTLHWTCTDPENRGIWQATHEGRRAHVFASDGRWAFFVDGGDVQTCDELDAAKRAVETMFSLHPGVVPAPGVGVRRLASAARLQPSDRAYLAGRLESVERYAAAVRELGAEGGDPALVRQMLAEAGADARALAEAGLELYREHRRALALAEARASMLADELAGMRVEIKRHEAALARVADQILRPCCEVAGSGDTRAIEALTGRVSIARNPARVELEPDAIDYLPADLVRSKIEPDKVKIREALMIGREVYGARIEQGSRVEVQG